MIELTRFVTNVAKTTKRYLPRAGNAEKLVASFSRCEGEAEVDYAPPDRYQPGPSTAATSARQYESRGIPSHR